MNIKSWGKGSCLRLGVNLVWFVVLLGLARAAPPERFALENVLANIDQPMSMRFLPDGRMVLVQKKGRIQICNVAAKPATTGDYGNMADPAHVLGIDFNQERGILDLAIDPAFPASPYIYILYTPANAPGGAKMRVARFTHVENAGGVTSRLDMASEVAIWTDTQGYDSCCHFGGGLDFGPDGNLWITTGDHFQGSYAVSRTHAGGKVHRIRKDGTIPPGNPYADGAGPNVDSVFAIGLRNPFRARWDLQGKRFFIAEVGGNVQTTAWEDLHYIDYNSASGRFVDSDFGKANDNGRYDGIDFGWPAAEGLPPYTDFPGANVDPAGTPIFAYKHNKVTAAVNGGVVYRGSKFPAEYVGAYFYADSTRDFVRYIKFKADGTVAPNPAPVPLDPMNPDLLSRPFDLAPVGRIVSLEVGPDGALYFVSFSDSGGAYGKTDPSVLGAVRRYVYDSGNSRPEITTYSVSPASGPAPLAVSFSIAARDGDNDSLTYRLDPGDGSALLSGSLTAGQTVARGYTYTASGVRTATVTVSDGKSETTAALTVQAGNPAIITSFKATNNNPVPPVNYFRYGDTYTFSATATSANGPPLAPESFSWSVVFIRPGNTHPVVGPLTGVANLKFPIPSQGQGFSGPVFYRCFVTVRDGDSPATTASIDIFPDKALIHFTSQPAGVVIQVDGNTAVPTPFTLDSLINFEHVITVPATVCSGTGQQKFSAWTDGPATAQRKFLVPPRESFLGASYVADGPCLNSGLVLSGLVVHLESDLNVGLQSGTQVATWLDQSGLGNDLQAYGDPQLAAGLTPSGKPALRLDGVGDKLERVHASKPLAGLPAGYANRAMFMVVRYPGGSSAWAGAAYGTGANNRAFGLLAKHPTGELVLQGWGSGNDLVTAERGIGAGWMVQSGMVSGGAGRLFKDGLQVGQFFHTYDTLVTKLVIGEEINNLGFMPMDIAALLIYDRALTNEELVRINTYLRKKYLDAAAPNTAPMIAITAPANNLVVDQGQSVTFTATTNDVENGDLGAAVTWASNLDGPLGTGASISTSALKTGNHIITASVRDNGSPALQASASVNVSVLVAGAAGAVPLPGALVLRLEADEGVGKSGSTVGGWTDLSGRGNSLAASGGVQLVAGQTPSGRPALRLDGTDDKLERVNATQVITGLPAGNAERTMFMVVNYPGASTAWAGAVYGTGTSNRAFGLIKHPTGQLGLQGWGKGNDLISATPGIGAGWMVQSGMLSASTATLFKDGTQIAQFTHTYDTLVSKVVVGEEIKGLGFVAMDVAALLVYNRALSNAERASVEAYLRKKYLDRNSGPVVAITAPSAGTTINQGQSVTFSGTASDPEDGNLAAAIKWTSNLSGSLGTGASISTTGLSVGNHIVTASVSDSSGQQSTATLGVAVQPATSVPLPTALVLRLEADEGIGKAGTTVSSWTDLSGRGNSLMAYGDPQLGVAPSGKPALIFDGTGDKLERIHASQPLNGLPIGIADRTMFMVVNQRAGTKAWVGAAYGTGAANQAFGLVVIPSGPIALQGWGTGNDLVSNVSGIGAGWLVQSAMLSGGTASLYKNGSQIAQFAHAYNTVLSKLVIGEEIKNLGFGVMDVAAVLIYNRALTADERNSVETYLRVKYLSPPAGTNLAATPLAEPEVLPARIEPTYIVAGYQVADERKEEDVDRSNESVAVVEEDPSLQLQLMMSNGKLMIVFPELKPTGDYHLHQSGSLLDIDDPGMRIYSIYREEILLMDPFTRLHTRVEIEPPSQPGFFRLFFEEAITP